MADFAEMLRPLTAAWCSKIRLALEYKKKHFQDDADECMRFFNPEEGGYNFLYKNEYARSSRYLSYVGAGSIPRPAFGMTLNKVAEGVQLFGPTLYHRNPVRQVNPRQFPDVPLSSLADPNDPFAGMRLAALQQQEMQQQTDDLARAALLESYLNFTPVALDLKTESRQMIDEAIIKGMGTSWHEVYDSPAGGYRLVGTFYDTVDNLIIDPDMESIRAAKWIARKCCHPVWEVEAEYDLPPGTLRGNASTGIAHATTPTSGSTGYERQRQGTSNDLLIYWKIYSKMGSGGKLRDPSGMTEDLRQLLEVFGDYCYLVVAEGTAYPLNLPPQLLQGDPQIWQRKLDWPTPYWADDGWPCTFLQFHQVPRCCWPMSHFKPAMGELMFLNWAYSFIAGKIGTTCRDFLAVQQSATEEIKRGLAEGMDLAVLEIQKHHGPITDLVQFLQHPQFNGDIWRVIEAVENNFEKRTGLTEFLYGETTSVFRSATEADAKADQMKIRPEDMSQKVEDTMTDCARKEALTARWHLTEQDVAGVLGPRAGVLWSKLVMATDPALITHQLEYRIEAGSTRKPNKARDASNMRDAMQTLLPVLLGQAQATGDMNAVNALISAWAKSIDLDASKFLLSSPPPLPAPGAPGGAPAPASGAAPAA